MTSDNNWFPEVLAARTSGNTGPDVPYGPAQRFGEQGPGSLASPLELISGPIVPGPHIEEFAADCERHGTGIHRLPRPEPAAEAGAPVRRAVPNCILAGGGTPRRPYADHQAPWAWQGSSPTSRRGWLRDLGPDVNYSPVQAT